MPIQIRKKKESVWKQLSRLFRSGPIVKHKVSVASRPQAPQGTASAYKKELTNLYSSNMRTYGSYERMAQLADFSEMNLYGEISAALDIYADEVVSLDAENRMLEIVTDDQEIKEVLETLFFDILTIEFYLWSWVRNLLQFGNFYLFVDASETNGILNLLPIPVNELEREEGYDPKDPFAVRFRWLTQGNMILENWQVIHFRLLGDDSQLPYGVSVLHSARRIWRQLVLIEDAMLLYRIVRCLHGDTNIWTKNGFSKIKDIKVGDEIWSYDYQKNTFVLSKVTDWINNGKQEIWEVKTSNKTIKSNNNHPFLTKNKETGEYFYVKVDELNKNIHLLITPDNLTEDIDYIKKTDEFADVYDIRVNNNLHNFIANGIVVHNSPERRVFKVEVGSVKPEEIEAHMEKIASRLKRQTVIDQNTGDLDLRYNPLTTIEDYFIPVRDGKGTQIDTLPGGQFPIRKDSDIPLLDGRVVTIEELAKEYNDGKENWVYSINDKTHQIVPGKVVWCGKNYHCKNIHRVWLNNNSFVDMAPEHPIIMRDGSVKRADEVSESDTPVSFFYEQKERWQTTCVVNPETNKWEYVGDIISFSRKIYGNCNNKTNFKNFTIKKVEVLKNVSDDVYCMTVVGPNGEQDRHNFAVLGKGVKRESGVLDGIFVKNTGDVEDVEYILRKLFSALKIPKAYLNYDEIGSKATLAQQDVRFSKTIQRIQKVVISELMKIAMIHLFTLGYRGEELVNFNLKLINPSTIAEQQMLELWRLKFEVAATAQEGVVNKDFIYKKVFGLSDEEIDNLRDGQMLDKKHELQVQQLEQAPAEEPGEENLEGEDELPTTLDAEEPQTEESFSLLGEEDIEEGNYEKKIVKDKNRGSSGDRAELSVDKGKNLFKPDENLFNHVFSSEKQTASDPYDTRFFNRKIKNPFSESEEDNINFEINEILLKWEI